MSTGAVADYFLRTDAEGNGTWQPPGIPPSGTVAVATTDAATLPANTWSNNGTPTSYSLPTTGGPFRIVAQMFVPVNNGNPNTSRIVGSIYDLTNTSTIASAGILAVNNNEGYLCGGGVSPLTYAAGTTVSLTLRTRSDQTYDIRTPDSLTQLPGTWQVFTIGV